MDIELTIDRFENEKAVLKMDNGETVIWPKDKLPENAKEGEIYIFSIMDNKTRETDKKELAKNILNEILNTKKTDK